MRIAPDSYGLFRIIDRDGAVLMAGLDWHGACGFLRRAGAAAR